MTHASRPDPEPAAGAPQHPVPPPPKNYASWIDKIVSKDWNGHDCAAADHARAELAALRKELSTTKGLLATARENLMEMDAQRAEAVEEREKYRHAARQFCGGHIGVSQSKCPACERDALRAQVAEMREAILGLGEIREFQVRLEFNRAQLDCGRADAKKFNALVTKLRAEPAPKALPGAGEPAAGEAKPAGGAR